MDAALSELMTRLDRLSAQFHELRDGIRQAINIADLDPEMSLTRARKVLEFVVRDVYERRVEEPAGSRPLENLLQRLIKDDWLPRRVAAYANAVRELGNVGTHAHGEEIDSRDVTQSLQQLMHVLEWYFEHERPDVAEAIDSKSRAELLPLLAEVVGDRPAPAVAAPRPAPAVQTVRAAAPPASVAPAGSNRGRVFVIGSTLAAVGLGAVMLMVIMVGVGAAIRQLTRDPIAQSDGPPAGGNGESGGGITGGGTDSGDGPSGGEDDGPTGGPSDDPGYVAPGPLGGDNPPSGDPGAAGFSAPGLTGVMAELALSGEWVDRATKWIYTIGTVDGRPVLTRVIDDDDDEEEYEILESHWDGTTLTWRFRVPSTQYTYSESITHVDWNQLAGTFSYVGPDGSTNTGSGTWNRREGSAAAQTILGEWVDNKTQAVYTIAEVAGEPTLTSVLTTSSESYEVLESDWDGALLRWKVRIPSSGTTMSEQVTKIEYHLLTGEYTYIDTSGTEGQGIGDWSRKSSAPSAPLAQLSPEMLAIGGEWTCSPGGATYTFEVLFDTPRLVSVVDSVNGVYEVLESNWDGTTLSWRYRTPSGYTTSERIETVAYDRMTGPYTSLDSMGGAGGSGSNEFTRKQVEEFTFDPPPVAEGIAAIAGDWICQQGDATYTFEVTDGVPRLVSAVDDTDGAYEVLESNWDGTTLSWRIKSPSSGSTYAEQLDSIGPDGLSGPYTSFNADGVQSTTGTNTFVRPGAATP